jgi:hypothetical protein
VYVAKTPRLAIWPSPSVARRGELLHVGVAVLLLAGCADGPSSGESPARPASPATYPDLASVPPRPVLSDTTAQRQQLQASLVSAREAADRRAAEFLYEIGRGPEPPPPPPPAPPAAPGLPPPEVGGDGRVARAYLDSSLIEVRDRGKLRQFMRRLAREAPDPSGPATLAQALGLVAGATEGSPPSDTSAQPQVPATPRAADPLDRFGNFDDDAFNPFR